MTFPKDLRNYSPSSETSIYFPGRVNSIRPSPGKPPGTVRGQRWIHGWPACHSSTSADGQRMAGHPWILQFGTNSVGSPAKLPALDIVTPIVVGNSFLSRRYEYRGPCLQHLLVCGAKPKVLSTVIHVGDGFPSQRYERHDPCQQHLVLNSWSVTHTDFNHPDVGPDYLWFCQLTTRSLPRRLQC